ncbi:16S rRNA (adenine(1518)-N(6)/adenine(1519)-N(6))-dimethyltransferase RsmA [Myxococcota bacterium]|nr:16S rRNA (adenine(1518)-N(6)/adenine(1519)-N(6))-dimethyltransferase RsmA [Myxococcota bacterium]
MSDPGSPPARGAAVLPATAAEVLRAWPGGARKRFGQHFLASDGIVDRILAAADLAPGQPVLEIGPGPGVLTAALLRAGAAVTAVELDRDAALHLRGLLPQVALVEGDATQVALEPLLPGAGWVCVSNLPYNVGTRILLRLLEHRPPFSRLVLMLQREVAERLWAPPGDRGRGSLSVAVQARATVERICKVPPGAFVPPPKVESAVVLLRPHASPDLPPGLDALLRTGFAAPRKTLRNNLRALGDDLAEAAMTRAGVDPGARPAALPLEGWLALARALASTPREGAG